MEHTLKEAPYLRKDPVVWKYSFYFHTQKSTLELKIKKEHFDFLIGLKNFASICEESRVEFGFKTASFGSGEYFGYDNCFVKTLKGETIYLSVVIAKENDRAISKTLTDVLPILNHLIDNVSPEDGEAEQDSELETACSLEYEFYGSVMKAQLSPKFTQWLRSQDGDLRTRVNNVVSKAMNKVYKELFELNPIKGHVSGLEGKGFLLTPPAGIYTCQFGILRGEYEQDEFYEKFGYETFCHNLDHHKQQLVLLAGFAKICEAFRESQNEI